MKTTARLALLLLAGLSLVGCATTQTASVAPAPKPESLALNDKPLSARDHFLLRDLQDKEEAMFEKNGR